MEQAKYIKLPLSWFQQDLSYIEVVLLGYIATFPNGLNASTSQISKILNKSRATISTALNSLEDKELITKSCDEEFANRARTYYANTKFPQYDKKERTKRYKEFSNRELIELLTENVTENVIESLNY